MKHLNPLITSISALTLPLLASTQKIITPQVDTFIQGILSEWGSAGGVSVAVVRLDPNSSDWTVETKGYGTARLSDNSSVTADTLFSIGSNSKLFGAIGTGMLVTNTSLEPRISWDTKIASLVPQWELADSFATEKSTILDLMGHRTGLPRHDMMYRQDDTVLSLAERLKFLRPSAELRETWQYNSLHYSFLSYLPEIHPSIKTPFARYIKQHVFDRLGMKDTTFSFAVANDTGRLASGVSRENISFEAGGKPTGRARQMPFWLTNDGGEDGNFLSGTGGVISSANDMAKWLQTLLLLGQHPETNETVIPAEAVQRTAEGISVTTSGFTGNPRVDSAMSPTVYGGGSVTGTYRGHVYVLHNGDVPGSFAWVARMPFDNVGVAVLTNDDNTGSIFSQVIQNRLFDEALGLEVYPWDEIMREQLLAGAASGSAQGAASANATSASANGTIPGGFPALEGMYTNPAYGNWTFCLAGNGQSSDPCQNLLTNLSTILPGAVNPEVPTLLAKVESVWVQYVKLEWNGSQFDVTALSSFPTINDPTQPFWTKVIDIGSGVKAEFDGDGRGVLGVGFTGDLWGASPGVPEPKGETVKEKAEVWFDRI
ncbi:hypothetical protein V5O48_004861 [Marasmius crinis-equi]|uniref:Beta-lactamase-related domain-containing protein n=1 Tax=Marasmius crinis-equi TaxID=585013 RepID=A0ABR3FNW2_9AGAR